jgi:hypothetical protein
MIAGTKRDIADTSQAEVARLIRCLPAEVRDSLAQTSPAMRSPNSSPPSPSTAPTSPPEWST